MPRILISGATLSLTWPLWFLAMWYLFSIAIFAFHFFDRVIQAPKRKIWLYIGVVEALFLLQWILVLGIAADNYCPPLRQLILGALVSFSPGMWPYVISGLMLIGILVLGFLLFVAKTSEGRAWFWALVAVNLSYFALVCVAGQLGNWAALLL